MAESRYSKYYRENKEKCAAASRAWRLANPEKVKEAKLRYRDKKAEGRPVGKAPRKRSRSKPEAHVTGLTEEARTLIGKVTTQPSTFSREGSDVGIMVNGKAVSHPDSEQIFDKDGVQIQYEGDEDLDLENERLGAGRRGLRMQSAAASRLHYQGHRKALIEKSRFYNRAHPEVGRRYRKNSISTSKYNIGTRRRMFRERRARVIAYYGGGKMACVLCGETREMSLTVDYTDPGRDRAIRYSGDELYRRLEADGHPEGYRTICANCQRDIRREEIGKMKTAKLEVMNDKEAK